MVGGSSERSETHFVRPRVGIGAGTFLLAAALLAIAASSATARGGSIDFGDAPDGAKARYLSKPKVIGHFPSKLSSGGPRHAGIGALRLGPSVDGEADSHQVDRDIDDGADLSAPRACKTATLTTAIKGSSTVAGGKFVYVNAWFDWNRDGDWADPSDGCAPEWGVRNLPVPASSIGSVTILPITLRAGKQVKELWYRVTVTLDEVQIDPAAHGRSVPYLTGETEDHLLQLPHGGPIINPPPPEEENEKKKREEEKEEKKKGVFSVRCVPGVRIIPHGASTRFGFLIKDKGKGHIFGRFAGGRKGKGFGIKVLPSGNQAGVPAGFVRSKVFRFKSTDVDPPTRIQVKRITVVFTRGKVTRVARCTAIIVHDGKSEKKKKPKKKGKDKHVKPPKIPKIKCESGCGGQIPTPPPAKETTLTEYTVEPGDHVKLRVDPTDPLEGLTIPLYPPNPTPRDPPKVTGEPPVECEILQLELSGGPAAIRCHPPADPFIVDSFFDIFYEVTLDGVSPISGTLDRRDGTPVEGFTAHGRPPDRPPTPPAPVVNGSGELSPGPNPKAVDFKVTLDAQNTELDQFVIQLPIGANRSTTAGSADFPAANGDFEGTKRALACNGPVTSGQTIKADSNWPTSPAQLANETSSSPRPAEARSSAHST